MRTCGEVAVYDTFRKKNKKNKSTIADLILSSSILYPGTISLNIAYWHHSPGCAEWQQLRSWQCSPVVHCISSGALSRVLSLLRNPFVHGAQGMLFPTWEWTSTECLLPVTVNSSSGLFSPQTCWLLQDTALYEQENRRRVAVAPSTWATKQLIFNTKTMC